MTRDGRVSLLAGQLNPTLDALDHIASFLRVTVADLFETPEPDDSPATATRPSVQRYRRRGIQIDPNAMPEFSAVPLLTSRIAAGKPLEISGEASAFLAFTPSTLKGLLDPVCVRVGPREESMIPTIHPKDTLLLDLNEDRRRRPSAGGIYALNVEVGGAVGGTVKRVELCDRHLVLVADNTDRERFPTAIVPVTERNLLDVIVGEVVWYGRYTAGSRRA